MNLDAISQHLSFGKLQERDRDVAFVTIALAFFFGLGFLMTVLTARQLQNCYAMEAALWSAVCVAGGFLIGFIFGIPKARRSEQGDGKTPTPRSPEPGLSVNTNLEEISDWLTKIIAGLGLVEIRDASRHLRIASEWIAQGFYSETHLAPPPQMVSFASGIILYFSIVGFLTGYLLTRLFFAGAFGRADRQQQTDSTYRFSEAIQTTVHKLRNYWKPTGLPDPDREKKLMGWLSENSIRVSLASFVNASRFEEKRQKCIHDLQL